MLETERSSDEALRQPTFWRLYLGALQIDNKERRLKACYIILLGGRLGLRTGEIQHVRESWIDWRRGEIAIPQHDPCGCMNCWVAAKKKAASGDEKDLREDVASIIENNSEINENENIDEIIDDLIGEDSPLEFDEKPRHDENDDGDESNDERSEEDILYQERWQPKYERSARRVPFGHSRRLTAVITEFLDRHEYLKITQPTMMNIVKDAAKNAEGVDSDEITIRGLRATAATHYATYIRNPKALQDLLGWTRIETAARYLRRAGAFTTDIVYDAFNKGDKAPVMYQGDPEDHYPLLINPIPYQNEPFDPVPYGKDARIERADNDDPRQRKLMHPRSKNPPDNINYDPTKHAIRTHEDYKSDIIERKDGSLKYGVSTLAEFFETHARLPEHSIKRRYESISKYREENTVQTDLSVINSEEKERQSKTSSVLPYLLERVLGSVEEISKRITSRTKLPKSPKSTVITGIIWILGALFAFAMLMFGLIRMGIISLQTNSTQPDEVGILAIIISIFILYNYFKTGSLRGIFK